MLNLIFCNIINKSRYKDKYFEVLFVWVFDFRWKLDCGCYRMGNYKSIS